MSGQKTHTYTDQDDLAHLVVGKGGKAWICGFSSMMWEDVEAGENTPPLSYLTVNLHDKWYGPALIEFDGEGQPCVVDIRSRIFMSQYYDYDGGSPCLDHAINPAALVWAARKNGAVVPNMALEMLIGRWIMEYHGYDVGCIHELDDVIEAGKRAPEVSDELQRAQKKLREAESVNNSLRDEIRAKKGEIDALKREVMEAKKR